LPGGTSEAKILLMAIKHKIRASSRQPRKPKGRVYRLAGNVPADLEVEPAKPNDKAVSVVIPVLNESRQIASVVGLARRSRLVREVIVVDDGSIDGTPELAEAAGARVITSSMLGKGASMEDGLLEAKSESILYLDGDLAGLADDLVERMCGPLLSGDADFVKASFSRRAGRVTVLTARPLLRTYFPEVAHFEQPLAGIIAARKELLTRLRFENDYGVDIGLLLDSVGLGARVTEVDIGHIEHDSHDLDVLGEMATQVARAILDRAASFGRLRWSFARETRERERVARSHPEKIIAKIGAVDRLALFDMDGTLLNARFVVELARETGREQNLAKYIDRFDLKPEVRARKIAQIFTGVPAEIFEKTARNLPLTPGAVAAVVGLRKLGYRVGIVSDSYHIATEIIRRRVFADFALSNVIEFRKGKATGQITLAPSMRAGRTGPRAYDKLNALRFLKKRMNVLTRNILAVGDGENDIGMFRAAGLSIAFQPKSERVRRAAKKVISGSLDQILQFV
jgi:glucosyl-3-phosphoglycerate synthase